MKQKLLVYQKEYNEVKDLQDLELKIKEVMNQLAWAIVRDSEVVSLFCLFGFVLRSFVSLFSLFCDKKELVDARKRVEKISLIIHDKEKKQAEMQQMFEGSTSAADKVKISAQQKVI
jgi:hypothetical protein